MPINSSQSRPFNIGDATIIVALTAIGLWGVRIIYHLYSLSNLDFFTIFFLGMPILMALTLGFLIIRLRSPRPNRRRLMRQPGFVACITIAIQNTAIFTTLTILELLHPPTRPPEEFIAFLLSHDMVTLLNGFSILTSWSLFTIAGHLSWKSNWIDRLGISLALGWIILTLVAVPR
ncbi:hypothetical protein [Singulisphaera acidiphila]|uniref:hypothetical protein n=1 Tax=Singulisphaera acidiphila TaxID=466153 RepID=UPI0012B565EE|nr:hypothetical protein [Singulisphaera acidiphila]